MKGTVIISETLLEAVSVIISFILIVLVVQLVFQSQTQSTYQSAFLSVARDISTAIDRAAAASGSLYIQQDLPKGLSVNVSIDYKSVIVSSGSNAVRKSFSGLTNTPPASFINPTTLCIVKTQNDNRVSIVSGTCQCNPNNNICDPACAAQGICDTACVNSTAGVCNAYCAAKNPSVCDMNCYSNSSTGVCESSCIQKNIPDGICSPDCDNVTKGVCDVDCYNQYSNGNTGFCDPDCPSKDNLIQVENIAIKPSDGKCYTGCVNYTKGNKTFLKSDGICDSDCNATLNICDPDCPNSPACQNICKKQGEDASVYPCCSGVIACPATGICSKTCCGNGKCEGRPGTTNGWSPGNKTLWETPYTCPQDCGSATRPSCSAGGPFVQSVCYRVVGAATEDTPIWTGTAISVCDSQAQLFLDRRNWDINEVLQTVKDVTPEGWAFDWSRYNDACSRVQAAGLTISANENYRENYPECCSTPDCPGGAGVPYLSECAGVGYCADHAAGILSILRTLGISDKDVFMTFGIFGQTCGRHAFVVMRCDISLSSNLVPTECQGHDNEWLRIDATQHFVALLKDTTCVSMGIWWNDKGIYPLTYGKIADSTLKGYVYPTDAKCNTAGQPTETDCKNNYGVEHHFDLLCQPYNVQCVVP
jgi:type II secretory pathway pseudopilin PulG